MDKIGQKEPTVSAPFIVHSLVSYTKYTKKYKKLWEFWKQSFVLNRIEIYWFSFLYCFFIIQLRADLCFVL